VRAQAGLKSGYGATDSGGCQPGCIGGCREALKLGGQAEQLDAAQAHVFEMSAHLLYSGT